MSSRGLGIALAVLCLVAAPACNRRTKPTTPQPAPTVEAPPAVTAPPPAPPRATERVEDRQPVAPLADEGIDSRSLDELNRNSPLRPAFFLLDSADLDDVGRS